MIKVIIITKCGSILIFISKENTTKLLAGLSVELEVVTRFDVPSAFQDNWFLSFFQYYSFSFRLFFRPNNFESLETFLKLLKVLKSNTILLLNYFIKPWLEFDKVN